MSTTDSTAAASVLEADDVKPTETTPPGYVSHEHQQAQLRRLRRIEGQVRGLQRMVESETYCIDILTQISAVNSALQSVALGLLDDHLTHCVSNAAEGSSEELQAKVSEASAAIARLVKS